MDSNTLQARHRHDVLHRRAISDEVIDARPDRYQSFEKGDFEAFSRLMRFDVSKWPPSRVLAWRNKLITSSGIVIKRFDARGLDGPCPYARFDQEVCFGKGKWLHYAYPSPSHVAGRIDTKALDVHPLVHDPTFADKDELYFCLEGSLKADAVLSAGEVAISSSSVTTWQGRSLRELAPRLKDQSKRVYVVVDSDFYESEKFGGFWNPHVVYQARAAGQYLQNRGVDVKIAVPWTGSDRPKVGIDDFLFQGYRLENLALEEPRPDAAHLLPTSVNLTRHQARILRYLLTKQGRFGSFYPHVVAKALGLHRSTVWRAGKRFEELGLMVVWPAPVELVPDGSGGLEWKTLRPNSFHTFGTIQGFKEWLLSLPVPLPIRQKLEMDRWRSAENGGPVERICAKATAPQARQGIDATL